MEAESPRLDLTLPQTPEGAGETRALSVPSDVQQAAGAPKIPGYILTAPLGQGAYAQVWMTWQQRTGKQVAVKVFRQREGVNWLFLRQEVERLIKLDKHPHIVSLLDADLGGEPAWYATDHRINAYGVPDPIPMAEWSRLQTTLARLERKQP